MIKPLIDIDEIRSAFAQELLARRRRKGWTQVELAARCGLDNSYISQLEKAMKTPTLDVVMRVAAAFGILPETLVRHIRQGMVKGEMTPPNDQSL